MWEEIIKQVLGQSLVAGVLLLALVIIYKELIKRMEAADAERKIMLDALLDNTRRTKLIERDATGEVSPTLPRRPVS
jgi:Na+-transporting NADH:ubiquinone oxidoreductase subunit NqrC